MIRFTKNELKAQKDALRAFQHYLPTLNLKMQQLKLLLNNVEVRIDKKQKEWQQFMEKNKKWIALFGHGTFRDISVPHYISVEKVTTSMDNIAGITVPRFICMDFNELQWDLFALPPCFDVMVRYLKELTSIDGELLILRRQRELIVEELRITTQRVNLFEKVKIPQTNRNIQIIRTYLGDQQTAAVVRGKIAKRKLVSTRGSSQSVLQGTPQNTPQRSAAQ